MGGAVAIMLLFFQAACDRLIQESKPERTEVLTIDPVPVQRPQLPAQQPRRQSAQPVAQSVVDLGSDKFTTSSNQLVRQFGPLARVEATGEITLSLIDATIPAAAKAVLGDALGLNYVIEGDVSGQITLQTTTPLTRDALLEAFQTGLEFNGATLAESGDLVTISPVERVSPRFVDVGDRRGLGRQIVVVPLKFIATTEMVRLLEPIVSRDAILRVSQKRNLLMVSGSRSEIDAILEAVNLFDVNVLEGKSIALVRLRAASPDAVATELGILFDNGDGGTLEGVIDFIPNERLGSILVISTRARFLADARKWIAQLDATAGQSKRFSQIYKLQNRTAEDLQPILADLIATDGPPAEAGPDDTGIIRPGGAPKVLADAINNAIVVFGTEPEQASISQLIQQMDETPEQVLLEATIAEVVLNDELDFGVRWFLESGNFSFAFSDLATGAAASSFPGFSLLFDSGNARVALNALSSITDVKIVSSPSLLVLDNREAELRVGDQVPVATESAVDVEDANAPVVNSISFRDTGIILKVKPRVSESGRVIMDIEQEVSDVVETTTSGIDSPTISQRFVKTSVVVDDGQTLALGGLIQSRDSILKAQVPLLGDIPFLGEAFKNRETDEERSELLILITPKVIRDAGEGRQITDEFRRRLSAPDALLQGRRPKRHTLDRLFN